jgi:ATP-dependent protease ClpP protease subunit
VSKRTTTSKRVRTAAALKADASLLVGSQPRVARAAAEGDAPTVDQETTTAELWLYGVVGGYWYGFNADSVSRALRGIDADVIYVRIHSPGGLAADGVAIGNLFRNHTSKIVVVVDGMAASAASVIAIAGDEIVMCPGSQMMLHDASTFEYGNAGDHRKIADWLDGQSQNYAGVYAGRAGGTAEQWRQVMLANDGWGTWYTAEDAVTAGLADSVGTRPAAGSPPTASEDGFDEDDDELLARVEHDLRLLEQAVHPAALAAWQGQAPKPPTASAGGTTQPEGAAVVDFNDKQITALREQVGFPADADADTIVAAVTEALAESADPQETTAVPEGMKLVSATVFDDVSAKADRGAKAAEELLTLKTDAFLDKYKDRFPPTPEARAKWAADFRRDPAGTEAYLSTAAPIVPTGEVGHGDAPEGAEASTTLTQVREDPGYKSWEI